VEKLVEHTKKLFEIKRATSYGMYQVDAELARVRAVEENAWNSFIIASNTLTDLLDYEKDTILLPVGYSAGLKKHLPFDPREALAIGMKNRPELRISKIDLKYKKILERF